MVTLRELLLIAALVASIAGALAERWTIVAIPLVMRGLMVLFVLLFGFLAIQGS